MSGEVIDAARFLDQRWSDQTLSVGTVLRGLCSVEDPARSLTSKTGDDLRSIERAAHDAHCAYRSALGPETASQDLDRARVLVTKLDAVLDWYLPDNVADEHEAELSKMRAEHTATPRTIDALAAELDDYATLASKHRKAIDGLGGFNTELIDEAAALALTLRELPAIPNRLSPEARDALSLRNRILCVLVRRLSTVRAAARFVFQDHPEIAREVSSQYERRRRAARRKNVTAESTETPAQPIE